MNLPTTFLEIEASELKVPKAIDFYQTLEKIEYSEFISAHKNQDGDETIVYDTTPEIDQKLVNDIRYSERLFVVFPILDDQIPLVFSLRSDFPVVPHLNAMGSEFPKCLCIYEEGYDSLKHNWRSIKFIERIRTWLSLTANGKLHQGDQPLEPFMLNIEGRVVLPSDYVIGKELFFEVTNKHKNIVTLVGSYEKRSYSYEFIVIDYELKPQVHNVVKYAPKTLSDLNSLLLDSNIEFVKDVFKPSLRKHLNLEDHSNFNHKVILIIDVPKLRSEDDQNPIHEKIGFIITDSFKKICIKANLIVEIEGFLGYVLEDNVGESISEIRIAPISIYNAFDAHKAAVFNGIQSKSMHQSKFAIIGCGSLGSQVFMNLVRSGYGDWVLIDDDILLPHNLARHSLHSYNVGTSKSEALAFVSSTLLGESRIDAIQDNYLRSLDAKGIISKLDDVKILIDASASIPVARKLASDINIKCRMLSVFLNPAGTDLVILAEPVDKSITLTDLEASYYKLLYKNKQLHGHIRSEASSIRYSLSCRDISGIMEQDNIAILSGIASKSIKYIQMNESAKIGVWCTNKNGTMEAVSIKAENYKSINKSGWNFKVADNLINKISAARSNKIPKETGGILIGMVDFENNTTHLVDTISPPDSKEYPNAYYRGISGIETRLEEIYEITSGNLEYIGEWHSHPNGCELSMSDDDKILFDWLSVNMSKIGFPPLLMIVGENSEFEIHNSK